MKKLLIYINLRHDFGLEEKVTAKIQIDNSLDLGWEKEDLILLTNFPYEYQGIKSTVLDDSEIYRHPTKMISAASFGIPTIAVRKSGYKEWEGNYIPVQSMEDMILEVEKLKNKDYYDGWSEKIIKAAEEYHISKIAEQYKKLN